MRGGTTKEKRQVYSRNRESWTATVKTNETGGRPQGTPQRPVRNTPTAAGTGLPHRWSPARGAGDHHTNYLTRLRPPPTIPSNAHSERMRVLVTALTDTHAMLSDLAQWVLYDDHHHPADTTPTPSPLPCESPISTAPPPGQSLLIAGPLAWKPLSGGAFR